MLSFSLFLVITALSSAKKDVCAFLGCLMSFVEMLYSCGDNGDPCGTPTWTFLIVE